MPEWRRNSVVENMIFLGKSKGTFFSGRKKETWEGKLKFTGITPQSDSRTLAYLRCCRSSNPFHMIGLQALQTVPSNSCLPEDRKIILLTCLLGCSIVGLIHWQFSLFRICSQSQLWMLPASSMEFAAWLHTFSCSGTVEI